MKIASSFLVILMLAASAQAADPVRTLLPAGSNDLVPVHLDSAAKNLEATATLDHQPAAMSWALDPESTLDARPQPFVQHSREYWIDASADQLQQGLDLSTSAAGAVIRMSPHADNPAIIDASTLMIRANGRSHGSSAAISRLADDEALHAAGMDVPQGSVVFRLSDSLGAGAMQLVAPNASGNWLVHVFEPASTIVMTLAAERDTVLAGQELRVRASIEGGAELDRLSGMLSSAQGQVQDFSFVRQPDGSWLGRVKPNAAFVGGFGLWEIHAFGQASNARFSVPRDARTALAVSRASARLDGSVRRLAQTGKDEGLTMRIGVQAASASRYQLAAVLYGTNAHGKQVPVAAAHSATWLGAGHGFIDLAFDSASLKAPGIGAPWDLRDLRLINQADMSLLERRERAASGF